MEWKYIRLPHKARTPFELGMVSTPPATSDLAARGNKVEDWHTPIGVSGLTDELSEEISIEEAAKLRPPNSFFTLGEISILLLLGRGDGKRDDPDLTLSTLVAVSIEPLDPATGVTVRDPKILGIYDEQTNQLKQIPNRDLNKEWYLFLKEVSERSPEAPYHLWDVMRDSKSSLESELPANPEKE